MRIRVLSLLIGLSLLAAACQPAAGANAAPEAADRPLRFGYSLWPGDLPSVLARERGFYAAEGVEVELSQYANHSQAMIDLLGGHYDGVTLSLGDAINLTQQTHNTRVVLIMDISAGGDAVVAQPGIDSVADLRGQRVGVDFGTFGELLVVKMLEANGLTARDVTLIGVEPLNVPEAMRRGQVQAAHTWEPYVSEAIGAGAHSLFDSNQTPGLIPDVAVFRQDVIEQRPEAVRRFVNAWFRAVDDWLARPAAAVDSLSRALEVPAEDVSLSGIRLLDRAANQAWFTPGDTTESAYFTAEVYIDFFIRKGAITRRPEADEILEPMFLK